MREKTLFLRRGKSAAFLFCALVLGAAISSASASTPVSDLPDFSPLKPFTSFGNFTNLNLVTINGNVGVSKNGKFMAPNGQVNGNVFLDSGVTKSIGGPTHINGSTVQPTDLSVPQALVFSASNILKNLSADYTLGDVKTAQTFNSIGSGMVTVIDMNSLALGGTANITFNGGSNDYFVLNIAKGLSMTGSSTIAGVSGVDPSHIFVNLYDNSGSLGTAAHINNVINGQVLVPFDAVTFHSMNGAVWGGNGQITFMSGATVNGQVPEPSSLLLVGFGGLVAAAFTVRRSRFFSRR